MTAIPAMTFGQFVKARRIELGYKVGEVAEKSGLSEPSIRQYENDSCRPFATNLYKLAAVYELTANDLQPYTIKYSKTPKLKPVDRIQSAIRCGLKDVLLHMSGSSPFEQKMRDKLMSSLTQCDEILKEVQFLDDAF